MYAQTNIRHLYCVGSGSNVTVPSGRGFIGARTDTTQQSGQAPDKEVEINLDRLGLKVSTRLAMYAQTNLAAA